MPVITLPDGREVDLDANPLGSTEGRPTNIPATRPPGWTPAYGAAPQVPDPIAAAWQALGGNMELLPGLFSMGNAYNLFNYGQRMDQVMGTPGWSGVEANLNKVIDPDLQAKLQMEAAQRGVSGIGSPDSPNASAAYLRALGLTGIDLQKLGQQQLNSLLSQFPQAAPFNLMSGMVDADAMQAALTQAAYNAGLPDPKAAADEEFRKLMAAIEAGKAAGGAGSGGPIGGGIDVQKIIDAFNAAQKANQPQTAVAHGPNQTVNRGSAATQFSTTYKDPGASGYNAQGIRNDVIKNAGANNYVNSIFKTPDYEDVGTRGGLGLDVRNNAVIGGIRPEQRADFGIYNTVNPGGSLTNLGDYTQFGVPINYTGTALQYDQNVGQWGYGSTPDMSQFAFGAPITSRNLYTGSYGNDWLEGIFSTPSFEFSGSLGGLALDPALSAILGSGGVIGQGSMFDPGNMVNFTPGDYDMFGQSLIPSVTPGGASYYDFGLLGGGGSNMASPAELEMFFGFD